MTVMLSAASDPWALLKEARAEIERLKVWVMDERLKRHKTVEDVMSARADNERLLAALNEMRFRDERNGSLPSAYRVIIDAALAALEPKP
jgi:hypothetical protein